MKPSEYAYGGVRYVAFFTFIIIGSFCNKCISKGYIIILCSSGHRICVSMIVYPTEYCTRKKHLGVLWHFQVLNSPSSFTRYARCTWWGGGAYKLQRTLTTTHCDFHMIFIYLVCDCIKEFMIYPLTIG